MDGPAGILIDVLYSTAESVTGTVGLTPLQVVGGAVGLLLVAVVVQIIGAVRGRSTFSLGRDDPVVPVD